VWEGSVGKTPCRVTIERDTVHLTMSTSKYPMVLVAEEVVEKEAEICFYGEVCLEQTSVILRPGGSCRLELSWLDGVFPFRAELNRARGQSKKTVAKAKAKAEPRDIKAEVAAAFEALVRENNKTWDDDKPHIPGPRPKPFRAKVAAFGAEACPLLISMLASDRAGRRSEAGRVLAMIGSSVTDEAREALRVATELHPDDLAPWLMQVDPEAAIALNVHLRPTLWRSVFHWAIERDAALAGRLLDELLQDEATFPLVVAEEAKHHKSIDRVAKTRPDLVPIARLRELTVHDDPVVRDGATAWLRHLNRPEDLEAALNARVPECQSMVDRLGGWPASDEIFELFADSDRSIMGERSFADLVVRRRCAGLSNPVDRLRPMLEPTLATERLDTKLYHTIVAATVVDDPRLGSAASAARERVPRASNMAECKGTLGGGDRQFSQGLIDASGIGNCAFRSYAFALFAQETAHAAFQLAWIDRAFGTPSNPARIEWIRDLGFRNEELLAKLATAPSYPLPGRRSRWKHSAIATQRNAGLLALHGAVAENAGLFGTAAAAFAAVKKRTGTHGDDHARCVMATQAHLELVAAATA
jgi:hypothetical protein